MMDKHLTARMRPYAFAFLAAALAAACGDNLRGPDGELPEGPEPGTPVAVTGFAAHWLSAEVIAVPPTAPGATFELAFGVDAFPITVERGAVDAAGVVELTEDAAGLPAELQARFPHLYGYRTLRVPAEARDDAPAILKQRVVVVVRDASGAAVAATRAQIPGVVDELFAYDGPLGLAFAGGKATFRLWAPTARGVAVRVVDAATKQEIATAPMLEGERGVWTLQEPAGESWYGHYYQYAVDVFVPAEDAYVTNLVTDPYSVGLSTNSIHSLVVDLDDPATKPAGWDALAKPALDAPEDVSIYELHVRDFSMSDPVVPQEHRGKFAAFTYDGSTAERPLSAGMSHLQQLAQAGLTHIHLLPVFDIATVNEDASGRIELDDLFDRLCEATGNAVEECPDTFAGVTIRAALEVLAAADPTTEDIQRIVSHMYELDGFNWGYDPLHYTAPEGSYATEPEGVTRIREFREMVQALAQNGLRVVMDVVYNHTHASGQSPRAVLDRIVPGYYHRLNPESGDVERSTCCENTATEHAMMEKLMIDSVVTWTRQYKVDGFRFDLMGHHMKSNMLAVKQAVSALTPAADGVDGSKVFLYGEGWNFGEVAGGARGENATQLTMPGTGIATFSDRLRDGVRGGGPFDGGEALRQRQGFATGLCYAPNKSTMDRPVEEACNELFEWTDMIRVGMAGNLAQFVVVNRQGLPIEGQTLSYYGGPAGYTQDPQEVITYIAAHDNQTLWDNNQYKLAEGTSPADRVRAQNVGHSVVVLGQGIPFIHAGADILRSKSFTRDSYNSGDWYNALDFTYQTNNWNVGLPRADKDGDAYPLIREIVADPTTVVTQQNIEAAAEHLRELLRIRNSSPLFRLRTGDEVARRVDFHNTGAGQKPGLIVQTITDGACAGADLDPAVDAIAVLINANASAQTFTLPGADGFALHPVLAASADPVVQTASFDDGTDTFSIPARTAAVFVQAQVAGQGDGVACNDREPVDLGLQRDVFVRGTMNEWAAPESDRLIADPANDKRFTADLTLAAGGYEFKIADSDWSVHNWGINGGAVTPGDGAHVMGPGAGNIALSVSSAGTYRFILDISNIANPTIAVEVAP